MFQTTNQVLTELPPLRSRKTLEPKRRSSAEAPALSLRRSHKARELLLEQVSSRAWCGTAGLATDVEFLPPGVKRQSNRQKTEPNRGAECFFGSH